MAVDKSLISGSTTMLILRLLEGKDMYGYEMIETLQEKSQNVFQLKAGTLYPLLLSGRKRLCFFLRRFHRSENTKILFADKKWKKFSLSEKRRMERIFFGCCQYPDS